MGRTYQFLHGLVLSAVVLGLIGLLDVLGPVGLDVLGPHGLLDVLRLVRLVGLRLDLLLHLLGLLLPGVAGLLVPASLAGAGAGGSPLIS